MNTTTIVTKEHATVDINKIRWVARAIDSARDKFGMHMLHVENAGNETRIVSTDGCRLHTTKITGGILEPGNYTITDSKTILVFSEDTEHQFPNWQKVVPENTWSVGTFVPVPWKKNDTGGKGYGGNDHTKVLSPEIAKLILATECAFNLQYLFDIAPIEKTLIEFDVAMVERPTKDNRDSNGATTGNVDPRKKAVTFTTDGRYAVIMPLSLER